MVLVVAELVHAPHDFSRGMILYNGKIRFIKTGWMAEGKGIVFDTVVYRPPDTIDCQLRHTG